MSTIRIMTTLITKISFGLFLTISLLTFSSFNILKRVEVKKAKVGDVELAYYTRGSGEPLLFINPFRSTLTIWDPALLERLEKHYTLILYDHRGTGLSTDTKDNNTSTSQMAEDAAGLLHSLGYKNVNVLGWSMGSRVAIEFALLHPEMIHTLILCSPNPGKGHSVPVNTEHKSTAAADLSLTEGMSLIFPDSPEGKEASQQFLKRTAESVLNGSIPNDFFVSPETVNRQRQAFSGLGTIDIFDKLPTIKIPTLVAAGKLDVLNNPENARLVAEKIPFSWLVYIPRAGHYFLSQENENAADLIHIFIDVNTKKNTQ